MVKSKLGSLLLCIAVYALAIALAYVFVLLFNGSVNTLLLTFIADVLATVLVFIFSILFGNASLYDPFWSVSPPFICIFWMYSGNENLVAQAMLIVILVWSVRLTLNWVRGWKGLAHEDWRYTMLREAHPKYYWLINFFGIHLFPTVMVFAGMLPVYFVTLHTDTPLLEEGLTLVKGIFALGFILAFIATVIELTADEQMFAFKRQSKHGEHINEGLWRYSRHPNYFGEIMFWFGLWVLQMSVLPAYWWTGIGFLSILCLFLFASIPMMEEKNLKSKKGYADYMRKVSRLIPLPVK